MNRMKLDLPVLLCTLQLCKLQSAGDNGTTALMKAFPKGAGSCVRLLLEIGANPNAVCEFSWNALMRALDFRYENVSDVKLLLEYNRYGRRWLCVKAITLLCIRQCEFRSFRTSCGIWN